MSKCLLVAVLLVTFGCFGALWFEDAWAEFFHWGPPLRVGSVNIESWTSWAAFIVGLVTFQAVHVYIEETFGRPFERQHIQEKKWTRSDVFWLSVYNFYKWLCTILYILVAITRLDIWLVIAIVDTVTRMLIWSPQNGRYPRTFTL